MLKSLEELLEEGEGSDFEAKAAQGRDGRGAVPDSIWETYSAMANSQGGTILLGAQENQAHGLSFVGLKEVAKVRKAFWDNLNNRQTANVNLLQEQNVVAVKHEGVFLLVINVPRAVRTQRPVYVGTNPMTGTYRRNYEGDYRCEEAVVRRMIAESVEDTRDARILPGYSIKDLDTDSLRAYRNLMRSASPDHPFLGSDDSEFLRGLGGWGENRQTGETGLTLAGLLMFGRLYAILDEVPYYVVDYQERGDVPSEIRWLDRVTTDGTWSGNLFDFYRRAYSKLTAELKVPFRIENGQTRIDESHVHEAVREALVNTLIHADFSDRIPVLVVKRPDYFSFRNPGGLRLPVETVLRGGQSDCRNRRLQKMFQLIGVAEQAGSGYPKILRAWREQHWSYPALEEKFQPEQTELRLPTTSLLPPEVLNELDERFGNDFRELSEPERLAIITACMEARVTNERLRTIVGIHSHDVTVMFKSLVNRGFLISEGFGRGTFYHLPDSPHLASDSHLLPSDSHLLPSDSHLLPSDSHLLPSDSPHYEHLRSISEQVRTSGKVSAEAVRNTILQICQDDFLSMRMMAELLNREATTLRNKYLGPLVKAKALEYRYPASPNHPDQGYRTVRQEESE